MHNLIKNYCILRNTRPDLRDGDRVVIKHNSPAGIRCELCIFEEGGQIFAMLVSTRTNPASAYERHLTQVGYDAIVENDDPRFDCKWMLAVEESELYGESVGNPENILGQ